ncbi:MAG: hypothetical protein GWN71_28625 [Gammaproteobacteria bacterium]|nr:hypothetical protein [Gemmatimonadota bacterium]NIU77372.1 hypothetical protein [Gammaproteobacteria bacterium]NIY10955.1 hypothetical protein [Gemmatimonadota bacterium]
MTWSALQAVAEVIGAIAVVASLVYLAIQVRQNTRAVRAATYDAMVRSSADFLDPLIRDGSLARLFESNVFYQSRQGTLEPWLWEAWRTVMLSYFHPPGIRAWWEDRRTAYSEPFRQFLETSEPPSVRIRTTQEMEPRSSARRPAETDET